MKTKRAHELLGVLIGTIFALIIVNIFQITSYVISFFLGLSLGFLGVTVGIIIYNWRQP